MASEDSKIKPEFSKFVEAIGDEVVNLYVGPKRKHFVVHKKLLCSKCPYFRTFFGNNKNSFSCHLESEEPDLFYPLIEWLYRGQLDPIILQPGQPFGSLHIPISRRMTLYFLAEKFEMTDLMDSIMETLGHAFAVNDGWPTVSNIRAAFHRSETGSTLRKYMAEVLRYMIVAFGPTDINATGSTFAQLATLVQHNRDLNVDVFNQFQGIMPRGQLSELEDPRHGLICKYHRHTADGACSSKGLRF